MLFLLILLVLERPYEFEDGILQVHTCRVAERDGLGGDASILGVLDDTN